MNFLTGAFAAAGLIAAAGPILIHLLNRRRFRTVEWAAMDFLREALQRNRKMFELRDMLLLALRVIAVAAFGLALARPFFTDVAADQTWKWIGTGLLFAVAFGLAIKAVLAGRSGARNLLGLAAIVIGCVAGGLGYRIQQNQLASTGATGNSRQPVHAILLIDNSLSMQRQTLQGTLLEKAKSKAGEFIEGLPRASRISIIPACGSAFALPTDAFFSTEAAVEAVSQIEAVDRSASLSSMMAAAELACKKAPELPAKRVVLLTDQQADLWSSSNSTELLKSVPDLQVVQMGSSARGSSSLVSNIWIDDVYAVDGVIDPAHPTHFIVRVQSGSPAELSDVQVTLSVDDVPIATRLIDLAPDQSRELEFTEDVGVQTNSKDVGFMTVTASVSSPDASSDQIAEDNQRTVIVPAAAELNVVFVDSLGSDETPDRRGETYRLRKKLVPARTDSEFEKSLVTSTHLRLEELDRDVLQHARMVVIAGTDAPTTETVALLEEYVIQGGNVIIVGGAEFSPSNWNSTAWQGGTSLLPLPLTGQFRGTPLSEVRSTDDFKVSRLQFNSMLSDLFLVPGETREFLRTMYSEPQFYRYSTVDTSNDVITTARKLRLDKLKELRSERDKLTAEKQAWSDAEREGTLTDAQKTQRDQALAKEARTNPAWLSWSNGQPRPDRMADLDATLERESPRILARFTETSDPALMSRRLGSGEVFVFTFGISNDWSNLFELPASLIFDRLLIRTLFRTLPTRTFESRDQITIPLQATRDSLFRLTRPSNATETLNVQAIGPTRYGIQIDQPFQRGRYEITQFERDGGSEAESNRIAEWSIAINGPAEESQIAPITAESFKERLANVEHVRLLTESDTIGTEGAAIQSRDLWKILIGISLVALLMEMLLLALPSLKSSTMKEGAE